MFLNWYNTYRYLYNHSSTNIQQTKHECDDHTHHIKKYLSHIKSQLLGQINWSGMVDGTMDDIGGEGNVK